MSIQVTTRKFHAAWVVCAIALLADRAGAAPLESLTWLGAPPSASPERIVSLAPSLTELLFALGEGQHVVGVTRFDHTPSAASTLPRVGGFIDPDIESIVRLRPDVVLAIPTSGNRRRLDALVPHGIPVGVLRAESLDDVRTNVVMLAKLLGREDRGEALLSELDVAMRAVRHPGPGPRALVCLGRRPLVAAGPGTHLDEALAWVGATNVVDGTLRYPRLDAEAVVALAPDVIIDLSMNDHQDAGCWSGLPLAVHVQRRRLITPEALLRLGPRLPEGLRQLDDALRSSAVPIQAEP